MSEVAKFQIVKLLESDLPKVVLSGPLSRDTTYTIHVTGPWRTKEIGNLIAALRLQHEWLAADEEAEAALAQQQLAQAATP